MVVVDHISITSNFVLPKTNKLWRGRPFILDQRVGNQRRENHPQTQLTCGYQADTISSRLMKNFLAPLLTIIVAKFASVCAFQWLSSRHQRWYSSRQPCLHLPAPLSSQNSPLDPSWPRSRDTSFMVDEMHILFECKVDTHIKLDSKYSTLLNSALHGQIQFFASPLSYTSNWPDESAICLVACDCFIFQTPFALRFAVVCLCTSFSLCAHSFSDITIRTLNEAPARQQSAKALSQLPEIFQYFLVMRTE